MLRFKLLDLYVVNNFVYKYRKEGEYGKHKTNHNCSVRYSQKKITKFT